MKLIHQITIVILTTLLLVVALVGISMYVSVERGFARYIRGLEEARLEPAIRRLTALYAREHSFAQLQRDPKRFRSLLRREEDERPPVTPLQNDKASARPIDRMNPTTERSDRPRELRGTDPLELPPRATLYDSERHALIGNGTLTTDASRISLIVDGVTIGWLGVRAIPRIEGELDVRYLHQVRGQLLFIALAAVLLGLLAGWLLARRLLRPIDALSQGTRRLRAGDYDSRIELARTDELGQLTRDFDALAVTLGEDSRARKRWVADTSHELRTPITILRAELEAILDGVRPADAAALRSLHTEIIRLGKLVDDLSELARADRGELTIIRAPLSPVGILSESLVLFGNRLEQRGIRVELDLQAAQSARILGDRVRLGQIFTNLLENSARYTDANGTLRITAQLAQQQLVLRFDDSAPGVPDDALPHLFDRLYRTESSRSRAHGGSGLGLSICQRLVEAHGGTITASASPLGGLRMQIMMPLLSPRYCE